MAKTTTAKKRGGFSDAHKQALAEGREQGRTIRRYLEAINKPGKRGRKRTVDSIQRRLAVISEKLKTVDPLTAVSLRQERMNLEEELARMREKPVDVRELEAGFVAVAKQYSERKGIRYQVWREAGVSAEVLKRAGLNRTSG
jgi:hypothetical protein